MLRRIVLFLLVLHMLCAVALAGDPAARNLAAAGLVEPTSQDASLVLDIRYATDNNFTGKRVYPAARCYLRADVAKRLLEVQKGLRGQGLGLKIYDCYRPFSVQEAFWRIMPDERYVGLPVRKDGVIVKSSRHNRGAAVDVTLVDAHGQELVMPTGYDDFTDKAHRDSAAASPEARRNSQHLERAMQAQGFEPLATEWWHFDGPGWQNFEPLDLPFPADR
ncbi:MAG: peptidase M15 [Deltaproteobacteria bacterium HGW-Deltaproteobacteria-8]|jgi:beta-N-acetylhexosaminidase/D-alanyl-D-alanine dipeptidase|nr:MAG: peptidase M15 [Deltaproteobacteria bacterium HGW-Deltaproteobacteria-8]